MEIGGRVNGQMGRGFLVLLGVGCGDTEAQAAKMADKVCGLRVFEDENEKMNLNLEAVGGSLLGFSQFTLYADTKSRRPGFTGAARPDVAIQMCIRDRVSPLRISPIRNTAITVPRRLPLPP